MVFFNWLTPPQSGNQPPWVAQARSKPFLDELGNRLVSALPDDPQETIRDRFGTPPRRRRRSAGENPAAEQPDRSKMRSATAKTAGGSTGELMAGGRRRRSAGEQRGRARCDRADLAFLFAKSGRRSHMPGGTGQRAGSGQNGCEMTKLSFDELDGDTLHEECGVFGILGHPDARR